MYGTFARRLERLWMLLDQGSSPVIRKAAADQIGEILQSQPSELCNLLRKVKCIYCICMYVYTIALYALCYICPRSIIVYTIVCCNSEMS